jgi:hypothetical protein
MAQQLYYQGRYRQDISLNAKYLVVHKSVREEMQLAYLAMQV